MIRLEDIVVPQAAALPDIGEVLAPTNVRPREWQGGCRAPAWGNKPPVQESADLERVVALDRRDKPPPHSDHAEALVELITARYSVDRGACACAAMGRTCITRLRLAQAWALYELGMTGGLLGPIGVGHGKTVLDIMAPLAVPDCKLAVLLVPPNLVEQLTREYELIAQHFRVPGMITHHGKRYESAGEPGVWLHVLPYSRLSRHEFSAFLEELGPDTIIADEVHKLRHADTATTARVLRYFTDHPATRFCGWSGSLTDSSIKDYAHLSYLALRGRSPLPLDSMAVDDWARALDPSDNPAPAGALFELCAPGEHVQEGFHRRLTETLGVISTDEPAIDAAIDILEHPVSSVPQAVAGALADLRNTWTRPDGEELVDAFAVARCARELACGFYYRWVFPRKERVTLILEWLEARKEWNREVRDVLKQRLEHLDSPLLAARAAQRAWGDWRRKSFEEICAEVAEERDDDGGPAYENVEIEARRRLEYEGDLPSWKAGTWPRWRDARNTVFYQTEPVRLDSFLAENAAAWARDNRGIVWYGSSAFGAWVGEVSGLPVHGGGPKAGEIIAAERGDRSIIASMKSHGTGRDGLQRLFSRCLMAQPPSSATEWEQVLGRLHRVGQESDIVRAWYYAHTIEVRDAMDSARERAAYVERTIGAVQKLRIGGG